jgi:hypothetical protein
MSLPQNKRTKKVKLTCRDCHKTFEVDLDKPVGLQTNISSLLYFHIEYNGRKYQLRELNLRGAYMA